MRHSYFIAFIAATIVSTFLALPGAAQEDVPFRTILSKIKPKDTQESLAAFQLSRGLRIELVCAEPLVSDPIAIDWGPDGRLWVVEMGDYPQGDDGLENGSAETSSTANTRGEAVAEVAKTLGGRIRFLEDVDRDGKYDRSTVFLDGLSFPTGVMVWGDGVLVTCAPEIFYAADTDGDGRADRHKTLLRGFVEGNPQHRVNCLRWGLDNWIHGANGDSGGTISSLKTGIQTDIHARDFRFRPTTGAFETETGMAQYGRCRDDWGNWFGGRNLQPIWHCALDDQYLRRNPFLVPPNPCIDLMDPPTCAPVYPVSTPLPRFNEFWTMNRFTAACGIAVYRDNLIGPPSATSVFVCEPTYNLVHRSLLEPRGATFRCRRAPEERESEFLASTDHWFRPVQARTGPDGALWVVDMYRLVIEHPDYIPEKWHDELDFGAGRGRGRIYRVLPECVKARDDWQLTGRSPGALARELAGPNGPRRDMIQQRLVEAQDHSVVTPLRKLTLSGAPPEGRLSALCTLDGLGAVDEPLLLRVLDDRHSALRRHAVRLAEPFVNESAELRAALLGKVNDPDARVRMQLAYTLGSCNDRRAGDALARIALRDAEDPLIIAAVMSSATRFPDAMLRHLLDGPRPSQPQIALIENLMRLLLEVERTETLALALQRIAPQRGERYEQWQYTLLAGLADALEYRGESFAEYYQRSTGRLRRAIEGTAEMFRQASRDAADENLTEQLRVAAIRLIGRAPLGTDQGIPARLSALLVPQTPTVIQIAVVEALARLKPNELPKLLLEGWFQHGPEIRPRIVELLLQREDWALALLDAVESGDVAANELGVINRNRMILHNSAEVRRRAARLVRESTPAERQAAIQRFRDRLGDPADVDQGRLVFRKHCASCHQLENEGVNIGPDLLAVTNRDPESLLVAILDPDRAVEPRYVEYSVITMRGRVLSGIVARETGNSLTLWDAQGAEHKLVRSDVAELDSTGKSLMPVGVEQLLANDQELLDLIAYVRSVEGDPADKRPVTIPVPAQDP